jgi:uncharacterized protein (DUF58 family)
VIVISRRGLILATILLGPAVLLSFLLSPGWMLLFFIPLFTAVLLDALLLYSLGSLEARGADISVAVGRPSMLEISLSRVGGVASSFPMILSLRPVFPPGWELSEDASDLILPSEGSLERVAFAFVSRVRGAFPISELTVRCRSTLGLLERQISMDPGFVVSVIPDLREVKKYLRMERQMQRRSWGVGATRFLSQQGEFDALREYQHGDDATKIDWSASTRLQQPLVKTYKPESSGWVTVILDAGRWMTGVSGDLSHFDRAINALVSLSGLVFGGGDYLRILVTADEVMEDRVFSPRRSDRQRFSRFVSGLTPRDRDFALPAAMAELRRHAHRMTALVVMAQFMPAGKSGAFQEALGRSASRSPVMLALLRDPVLDQRNSRPVPRGSELVFAAAADLAASRSAEIQDLRRGGFTVLDIRSEELTASVINSFRSLRRSKLPAKTKKYRK